MILICTKFASALVICSKKKELNVALLILVLMVGGCASPQDRFDHAAEIAHTGHLSHGYIQADPFVLTSWKKFTAIGKSIHVYIEGDGLAWLNRSTPSNNPTPKHPVALALAAADPAPNVIYLARPCQYTKIGTANNYCKQEYWMGKRFSREVIDSYHRALNQLSTQHDGVKFHLIGYSGGANIAGLLASEREDILSLRTVVGNVDNDFFTSFHRVSPMPLSLNMANNANAALSAMPQFHFIAAKDKLVPVSIFKNYVQKLPPSSCLNSEIVDGTTHSDGWEERWKFLLHKTPVCKKK